MSGASERLAKRALSFLTSPLSAGKERTAKKARSELFAVQEDVVGEKGGDERALRESMQAAVLGSMQDSLSILTPASPSNIDDCGGGGESDVLAKVIPALVPVLATAVSVAVEKAMERMMRGFEERLVAAAAAAAPATPTQARFVSTIRRLTYENDRLAQYTRRESLRIAGVPQVQGETVEMVEEKVIGILKDAGVEAVPDDFAAVHRVGNSTRGPRAILVKFVSRRKRREVMMKKKNLKDKDSYKKVYLNDDLTPLRGRLLGYVKSLPNVERAWTKDGRIFCAKRVPLGLSAEQRPKPVVVEDPDDLFKLGVDVVDYNRLGLGHLVFDEEEVVVAEQ